MSLLIFTNAPLIFCATPLNRRLLTVYQEWHEKQESIVTVLVGICVFSRACWHFAHS